MNSHGWLQALHLIFMVTWFAGLFYLPRLFVYHAQTEDQPGRERFKVMERRLMSIIKIGEGMTWVFGIAMLVTYAWSIYGQMGWLHAKLALLVLLSGYTGWCGRLVKQFAKDDIRHTHTWYRWFNEVPVIFLVVIVLLATLKPF
jgi:putative membrane protein